MSSKRDFLRAAAGLPLGYGAAGVLAGCSTAAGAPHTSPGSSATPGATPQPPISVATQFGTTPSAVAQAIAAASTNQQGLLFESGVTFTIDSTVVNGNNPTPTFMIGYGATLAASANASGALLTLLDPQNTSRTPGSFAFLLAGLNIDGQGRVSQTLAITGSQFARYQDLTCTGSTGVGIELVGSPSQGVYTNEFANVLSTNNGGAGWYITTAPGQTTPYNAGNTFLNCSAQFNGSYGWNIDLANNSYIGCDAEDNAAAGFNIARTQSCVFVGGYSENNPNANPGDQSFVLAGNASAGVVVIGGRHTGAISGSLPGNGNVFLVHWQNNAQGIDRGFPPGYVPFGCDENGFVSVAQLGVANSVPTTAVPGGATVSAIPVFDANGNPLGYVPVYKTLW